MHISEFIDYLNEKGHDTGNIDLDTIFEQCTDKDIYLYNHAFSIDTWDYRSYEYSCGSGFCIKFDKNGNMANMATDIDIIYRIPTIYSNIGNNITIKWTDNNIVSCTIPELENIGYNRWNLSLPYTYNELYYTLLYNPNKKEEVNDITLFYRDSQVVFISIKDTDIVNNIAYDKYLVPNKYMYLFNDTTIEPSPFFTGTHFLHGSNELFLRINKEIDNIKYIVPKWEVLHYSMFGSSVVTFNKEDTYGFNIHDLNVYHEVMDISHTHDMDETREYLISLICKKYEDKYLIKTDNSNVYHFSDGHPRYYCDSVPEYIEENKLFIMVRKGTVVNHMNQVFPIQKDLKCIDIHLLPKSWKNSDVVYIMRLHLKNYMFYDKNTGFLYSFIPVERPLKPVLFKVYVMDNYRIYPIYNNHLRPYKVYDTSVEYLYYSDRASIFLEYGTFGKLNDTYFIYQ